MLNDDPKRKWTLICQHKKPEDSFSEKQPKEPYQYIEELRKKFSFLFSFSFLKYSTY